MTTSPSSRRKFTGITIPEPLAKLWTLMVPLLAVWVVSLATSFVSQTAAIDLGYALANLIIVVAMWTFIGNSGVVQYFGSRDRMTAEYFQALCGGTTVWNFSSAIARAFGTSSGKGGVSSSRTTTHTETTAASQRQLAYADELMRMHGSKELILIENLNPIIGNKVRWFDDEALKALGRNLQEVK